MVCVCACVCGREECGGGGECVCVWKRGVCVWKRREGCVCGVHKTVIFGLKSFLNKFHKSYLKLGFTQVDSQGARVETTKHHDFGFLRRVKFSLT